MKMISADDHVDGCVHFNTADFSAGKVLFVVDVVDMIILNNTEHTSHPPHNTSLLTVMNMTAAHNMAAYLFF